MLVRSLVIHKNSQHQTRILSLCTYASLSTVKGQAGFFLFTISGSEGVYVLTENLETTQVKMQKGS